MSSDGRPDGLREILRSPVEPKDKRPAGDRSAVSWLQVLAGGVVGVLAVAVGYLLAGSGESSAPTTTLQRSTTTTTIVSVASGFPADYVQVTDLVAARPVRALVIEDRLVVSFTTATLRTLEPDLTEPFAGGDFTLVLEDGREVAASELLFDFRAPGTFSVAFPFPEPPLGLSELQLTGVWRRDFADGSTELALDGLPASVPGPVTLSLPIGGDIVLADIELRVDGGEAVWKLGTEDVSATSVSLWVDFLDGDAQHLGRLYSGSGGFFGGFGGQVVSAQPVVEGTVELTTSQLEGVGEPERVARATVSVNVTLVTVTAVDVTIDVGGLDVEGG